jgi:hypothetical protein
MASTIKVTNINTPDGTGNITLDRPTVLQAGDIVTADIADVNVTTAKIADNAITLAKMAGGTDGQIITYDASGDPVAVGPGTDGQVLTSTGAGSPPAFEAAAGGGAWTILQTTDASGASSIDFTNVTSTYDTYVMTVSDMRCSADGNGLNFRFGDSSGFDSGGSDYQSHEMRPLYTSGNTYAGSNGSGAQIGISHALGSGTGEGYGGVLYIHQPSDGVTYPMMSFHSVTYNMEPKLYLGFGGGARVANIVMDRFQIYPAGGTLTGRATVYGIKHA